MNIKEFMANIQNEKPADVKNKILAFLLEAHSLIEAESNDLAVEMMVFGGLLDGIVRSSDLGFFGEKGISIAE